MRTLLSCLVCLAVGVAAAPRSTHGEPATGAAKVAAIGQTPITAAELAGFWFDRYPEEYARTLRALIDARVSQEEAQRIGLFVPQQALDKAVAREVEARRDQLARLYGEGTSLENEIRRAYDLDVTTWRDRVLRTRLHRQLLLERVVRWDTRSRRRVHARVIVRKDRAGILDVARRLQAGADFGLTALKESEDPTAKRNGELPWIARGDLAFPRVEARLFQARRGTLVGPLEVQVDGEAQWHIYKIVQQIEPWQAAGIDRARRLEADLLASPVDRGEYERWHRRMSAERGVRFFRPDGRTWLPPTLR